MARDRQTAALPLLLAVLAAGGCGDTLVDHDGRSFVQTCDQPGQHSCDRGTGAVCEPVSAASCGDGLACTDCTAGFSVSNGTPVCQANGTCGYQCDPGWLRCDAGCCRAIAVAAGAAHTCAIVAQLPATSGQLKCWGANDRGQLGTGDTADRLVPASVATEMNSGVTMVAAGAAHTCAVKGGALYCWGANGEGTLDGRLGVTTGQIQYNYPQTVNLAGVNTLAPGERHTCALASGSVYCWGANDRGQLGFVTVPSGSPSTLPPPNPTLTGASALASGRAHACALTAAGVSCWGANDWGQLGNGATPLPAANQPTPVAVINLPAVFALAAGARHACAIDSSADPFLWCWGENTDGQLGRGSVGGAFSTPDVAGDIQSLRPVAAVGGRAHTCGNKGDVNGIKCVGSNASGQLGGPGNVTKVDVQIGQAASAIAAGDDHGCALGADGSLFCWGANARGQVGDGLTSSGVFLPTLVSGR
jgi:alpha-tubulin suppressor-like RCC1 family protein